MASRLGQSGVRLDSLKSLERRIPCPLGFHCPFDPSDLLTGVTIRFLPRVTLHLLQRMSAGCSVTKNSKEAEWLGSFLGI